MLAFLEAMRTRFEEFALSLHPDKTRLIEFGRRGGQTQAARAWQAGDLQLPWLYLHLRQSRRGKFLLKRKTRSDRVQAQAGGGQGGIAAAQAPANPRTGEVAGACRSRVLQLPCSADKHCRHSGSSATMSRTLATYAPAAQARRMTRHGPDEEAGRRLPPETAYPSSLARDRFAVKHPRWEPYAGIPPVRICAGGAQ